MLLREPDGRARPDRVREDVRQPRRARVRADPPRARVPRGAARGDRHRPRASSGATPTW
nr:hypothetical protein [Angustibacter aerolatus]